jgi:hypothetical protein
MILFETNYIKIGLDEAVPCLEWIAKKNLVSAEFRESEEKSLSFFLQYKPKYPRLEWFVDSRNVVAVVAEDMEWVATNILPKFAAAGLTKESFVVPTSVIGKMVVKNYMSEAGKTIEVKVFDSAEAAKAWLKA